MPTRDRPHFVCQAARYFLRQDYPKKQLVVVDDGERAIGDLLPEDDRIRYVRLERRTSLGAKRNVACEATTGDIIAHFDDADWMAPDRLRRQVAELYRSESDICGLSPLRYFNLTTGESFLYRNPRRERWVAPSTLVYRRSTWSQRRFPELEVGDTEAFVSSFDTDRIHCLDAPDLYVALLHPGNQTPVDVRSRGWQRTSIDDVGRLILVDREFYVRLRNGSLAYTPRPLSHGASVTFVGGFVVFDGYGSMSEYALLGMMRSGATVDVVPQAVVQSGLNQETLDALAASRPKQDSPVLYYSWPQPDLNRFRTARDLFIFTMVESSRVPQVWVSQLNHARCVVVPTRYMANAFRESGVTVPIEVAPQGIDPAVYHYEERPERPGMTTLIVATVEERKHTREGIEAWRLVFADDPNARLIIKARFQYRNYEPDDPRIVLVDDNEASRGIARWYREADVLMALGNEGFGLPLVEGMATGLPVIALDAEGQSDACADARGLLLPVPPAGYRPHVEAQKGDCGVRAYPSVETIAGQLRWVATHREEALAMGRAASEWATVNRNVWNHGPALLDLMERRMSARRPLRRRTYLWVASWGKTCGIAEYTRYLQAETPEATVGGTSPDPQLARLVHLQHEDGLHESDVPLAAEVARLHQAGVRVIVTEHTVTPGLRVWERDADALISLTAPGADALRRKWPGKRVEHIPHGCHEYFPARKQARGKVIGTFGFAGGYKGIDRLFELWKAITGSRLLIYSHDRGHEMAQWMRSHAAADGVRLITDFKPPEEVAAGLAAEADMLVFWYQPVGGLSASGAVRIGLASGVPVMTSPTPWFQDLKEVTYQPADPIEGARRLLDDDDLRQRLVVAARDYCHQNSWKRIGQRHRALWESLQIA
jgi:glycosyltransferase involved in cell wall biosynthesis